MSPDPSDDGELLDAYSRTLIQVAAALAPSVAGFDNIESVTSTWSRAKLNSTLLAANSSAAMEKRTG